MWVLMLLLLQLGDGQQIYQHHANLTVLTASEDTSNNKGRFTFEWRPSLANGLCWMKVTMLGSSADVC